MIIRKQQHEEAQLKFTQQCGAEQKELLMTKAQDMLKVLKIKQMTAAADIARKEKARAVAERIKAEEQERRDKGEMT